MSARAAAVTLRSLAFAAVTSLVLAAHGAQNALEVRLEVPWPTHKLWPLLETSEALGEDNVVFWGFVDQACKTTWEGTEVSTTLSQAVDLASRISQTASNDSTDSAATVDEFTRDLLRLSLELREFAPAIEQQRQLGLALRALTNAGADFPDDGRAWVALTVRGSGQGTIVTDFDKLPAAITSLMEDLANPAVQERCKANDNNEESRPGPLDIFNQDHVHPQSSTSSGAGTSAIAILHGILGRADFVAAHQKLSEAVEYHKDLVYVVRHMPGADAAQDPLAMNRTALQGFGVALDIKNMEYLTVDDDGGNKASEEKRDTSSEREADLSSPVAGIHFDKMIDRLPESKDALVDLHTELEGEALEAASKSGELAQIKVWDMVNLGLQATAKVLADADPLNRWEDLSQNFPSRARALINMRVPDGLLEEVERAARSLEVPDGTVLVNGVSVDAKSESFNIFSLMESIRAEIRARETANAIVSGGGALIEPLAVRMSNAGASDSSGKTNEADAMIRASGTRVDVRADAKGAVIFLNNIEKDKAWTLNGLFYEGSADFQSQLVQEAFREQRILMYQVHLRRITSSTNVLKYMLEHGQAIPRYNRAVFQETAESAFLTIPADLVGENTVIHYMLDSKTADVTVFLALDEASMITSQGRSLLRSLVAFTESKPSRTRIAVLPVGLSEGDAPSQLAALLHALRIDDLDAVDALLSDDTEAAEPARVTEAWMATLSAQVASWKGLQPLNVVFNGRVIAAASPSVTMTVEDFDLAVSHERKIRADFVRSALGSTRATPDAIMQLSPLVAGQASSPRRKLPMINMRKHFPGLCYSSTTGSTNNAQTLTVQAVIDPLSEAAPRVSAVVRLLRDKLGAHVDLVFTPKSSVSAFPLSSYFRFLASNNEPDPALGGIYPADEQPAVRFYGMPQEQLLTLKVYTPEPWIVYPTYTAGLDTDNIRLSRAESRRSTVTFALSKLLVTGHCVDEQVGSPPAGLQIELQPLYPRDAVASDTLVMQNLGYMQLQAGPGLWELGLAKGPSRDIFSLHQEHDTRQGSTWVALRSFTSAPLSLQAARRPGHETDSLLASMETLDGEMGPTGATRAAQALGLGQNPLSWLFDAARRLLGMETSPTPVAPIDGTAIGTKSGGTNETIHVFSLASGALYERFLRIMMVSVTKATQNPVKFWLIENFLSPDFKAGLGALQNEYGFEVALVTYKWPHWLRRQTEKQRIIWGYKILFLDVLFPLDVPKVIYVDADQVVRADLKELWDMDLEGKPYGYTPFCTSREETLGFQFWRSGYWKDHLRGNPYHISALYVVDLQRFRHMMVGDRLRAVYDQLSRDPNSLSNLDQDLPNYAQHMVPIFSLPQEWLWCESWCSDESKRTAKTIDLCNNPLHKEPKLDMAKRVISGELFPQSWVELDAEIKNVLV
ncbi:UDP-glucose:glycoprotein glucosyltransferase [Hondaea fermentalgiana]|uniref:UDP-glucose:glycoprotein glucosyltransferase n=1 Tax=Hondaea fermentalgiana TaxID=2315210 RepID=A0A2R5G2C9_9STRA|nr:UDP-glucose:glycoprotein glucosyltransferase [Hondaea fermentalgiana]|eukprot:GBG24479.1 UDP-glucose:glycoprotein glucosyltransferase [Hondaea fermentalgiana]